VTDRIELRNMRFEATHGVYDHEQRSKQPFEVDVELILDLGPAGRTDDLEQTVDYARVYAVVREIVEGRSFRLLEALAETISQALLAGFTVAEVLVRIRKPAVDLGGPLDYASVEISRRRP
jgi:7,8-dihydroneopterin aldolase/epimerase/oxygenase